jgi:hypothetical protein
MFLLNGNSEMSLEDHAIKIKTIWYLFKLWISKICFGQVEICKWAKVELCGNKSLAFFRFLLTVWNMFYCKKITELKGYFEKDSHMIIIKKSGYVSLL